MSNPFDESLPARGVPDPSRIADEVNVVRGYLYMALGSISLLTGHIPPSAVGDHIKRALDLLPKRPN